MKSVASNFMMQHQSEDKPMYKHPKEDNILDRTDAMVKFVHVWIVCLPNGHELGKLVLLLVRLRSLILLLHLFLPLLHQKEKRAIQNWHFRTGKLPETVRPRLKSESHGNIAGFSYTQKYDSRNKRTEYPTHVGRALCDRRRAVPAGWTCFGEEMSIA